MSADETGVDQVGGRAEEAMRAVLLHGLLNSMGVIKMVAVTVENDRSNALTSERARRLLGHISKHADVVSDGLRALLQGVPVELIESLDSLGVLGGSVDTALQLTEADSPIP